MKNIFAIFLISTLAISNTSFADEEKDAQSYPNISGNWLFETQLEHGYKSDNKNNERTNLFGRSELSPTLRLNENFYIDGVLVLEPTKDSKPGTNTFFDQESMFIERLKVNYENGPWGAFAGKTNPNFGIGWDYGRGIWGEDFAEDYEITQKVGFGGSYTLDTPKAGSHKLTATTFFADHSFLSGTAISRNDRVRLSDGGASNTGDLSSYVVSLEGEKVANVENLKYKLGYRHLSKGDASTGGDENGVIGDVGYIIPVSDNLQFDTLVEYTKINNFDSNDEDRQYAYANVIARIYQDWNITAGYTARKIEAPSTADVNDHLFQLTGGYDFGNGLTLEAGWRNSEEANVDTNILGGLARYTLEF